MVGEGGVREVLVVRFIACTARVAESGRGTVTVGAVDGKADEMRETFSVNTPA